MLLMIKIDSAVWVVAGIMNRSGEQNGRLEMHKICAALIKEKAYVANSKI